MDGLEGLILVIHQGYSKQAILALPHNQEGAEEFTEQLYEELNSASVEKIQLLSTKDGKIEEVCAFGT